MTTLSIRLPDDMAERLKDIAKVRGISLNKLMFELSTVRRLLHVRIKT